MSEIATPRLTVFADMIAWFDGTEYSTDEAFVRFVDGFVDQIGRVGIICRVSPESRRGAYRLDPERFLVTPLPYYPSLYSLNPVPMIRGAIQLHRIHAQLPALLIRGPNPLAVLLAFWAARDRRPRALYVGHELVEMVGYRAPGAKRALAVLAARILDVLWLRAGRRIPMFTVGQALTDRYGGGGARATTIFTSTVRAQDLNSTPPAPRQAGEPMRIVTVGRLEPEKGTEQLVRAVGQLKEEGLNISWEIIGGGESLPALRRAIESKGLGSVTQFAGYVPNGPELFARLRHAHVLAMSSYTEGFPRAVIEALSQSTPVVATDVGGISQFVRDGVHGLVVPPRQPALLAAALRRLYEDDALRCALGVRGYQLAVEITRDEQVKKVLAVLFGPAASGGSAPTSL